MHTIGYEQIIAVLGMCIWFVFPIGMFVSLVRQDRQAMPAPHLNPEPALSDHEKLKFFEHKQMTYNDDTEELESLEDNVEEDAEVPLKDYDEDFNHPHTGIGSTHTHHLQ
jgi:hypothetical protein